MAEHINWHTEPGYDSKYMGEWDLLEHSDMIVKIADIKSELIQGQGGSQEKKLVAYFEGIDKPMILNKTNLKAIAKSTQTDYLDQMCGKYIQLYRDNAAVAGKVVKCIRVRDFHVDEPKK